MPIFPLLEDLDNEYLKVRKHGEAENLKKGVIFRAFLLGVSKDYLRMGLGYVLTQYAAEAAKRAGFKELIGECTNDYSTRILEKMGGKCSNKIVYKDYELEGGEKPYEDSVKLTGFESLNMMYMELEDFNLEDYKGARCYLANDFEFVF